MSSMKCPHCGLVNFSGAETCKRCQKDLSTPPDKQKTLEPFEDEERGFRFKSDYPVAAWIVTVLLAITTVNMTIGQSLATGHNGYYAFGAAMGALMAWPLVLLILYALLRRFREKYSLHAVINYGLAMNTFVAAFLGVR